MFWVGLKTRRPPDDPSMCDIKDGPTDSKSCDPGMKSVEGVNNQSSLRSLSILSVSLSKISIQKGKASPKKKNGSKNRYTTKPIKSSHKHANIKQQIRSMLAVGSSILIPNLSQLGFLAQGGACYAHCWHLVLILSSSRH